MPVNDRPTIHAYLSAARDERDSRFILVWDTLGLTGTAQRFTHAEFACLQLLDGERTLSDVHHLLAKEMNGDTLTLEAMAKLVQELDEALFLEGPRFREKVAEPIREPRCIGCYEGDPDKLRRQIHGLFTSPQGPGLPTQSQPDGKLHAALIPHIDYPRGGHSYAWGFKEVFERTEAALFVIIGTSHYSSHRFTLTRKHFKTPLGITSTDQEYIDRLVELYGPGLFDDEITHLPEHSIELEVVFLQYLYENRRPIRIVPLLVGSFQDCILTETSPSGRDDIGRMVRCLRQLEEETKEPICYIISGDLAHIGPKFGDRLPVTEAQLARSRKQDLALLAATEQVDTEGYFRVLLEESDRRRICGFPPTVATLEAIRPERGKVLNYDRYVHPRGFESVSFASVGFYRR